MIVGLLTTLQTAYSAGEGMISSVSNFTATLSSLLAIPISFIRDSDKPQLKPGQIKVALNAMGKEGINLSANDAYFLYSGCSFSIMSNSSVISDLHDIEPVTIESLTGKRVITKGCTLWISVPDLSASETSIVIKNVLYDPLSSVNLI